jgi:hypothetical protein
MSRGQVPFQHFRLMPAFDTGNIIALNGSPDRHHWSSLDDGFCCRFTEGTESLMDGRDQRRELVRPDLIALDIRGHDFCGEFSIGRCNRFVGHPDSPIGPKQYHTRQFKTANEASPHSFAGP